VLIPCEASISSSIANQFYSGLNGWWVINIDDVPHNHFSSLPVTAIKLGVPSRIIRRSNGCLELGLLTDAMSPTSARCLVPAYVNKSPTRRPARAPLPAGRNCVTIRPELSLSALIAVRMAEVDLATPSSKPIDEGLRLDEAITRGAQGRLRAVLVTALVASPGFVHDVPPSFGCRQLRAIGADQAGRMLSDLRSAVAYGV